MEEFLRNGECVFIFPEGTFSGEDGVRPFQLGAFKAAVAVGAPIISVLLSGTRRFLRDCTYLPPPTRRTLTLSPPIYSKAAPTSRNLRVAGRSPPTVRRREAAPS